MDGLVVINTTCPLVLKRKINSCFQDTALNPLNGTATHSKFHVLLTVHLDTSV